MKKSYKDLGYAKIEPLRISRQGFPEAIYCPGKSIPQVVNIFTELYKGPGPIIATRVQKDMAMAIKSHFPKVNFYENARLVIAKPITRPRKGRIAVVCAGTADLPVAEEAALTATALGCPVVRIYDVGVAGIHRLLAHESTLNKVQAIIVCAGMEGALPSVVGGLVSCPVVAVPTSIGYGAHLQGIAPLLTMLNSCASNVSVVNIDNGFSAGIIASLMARS